MNSIEFIKNSDIFYGDPISLSDLLESSSALVFDPLLDFSLCSAPRKVIASPGWVAGVTFAVSPTGSQIKGTNLVTSPLNVELLPDHVFDESPPSVAPSVPEQNAATSGSAHGVCVPEDMGADGASGDEDEDLANDKDDALFEKVTLSNDRHAIVPLNSLIGSKQEFKKILVTFAVSAEDESLLKQARLRCKGRINSRKSRSKRKAEIATLETTAKEFRYSLEAVCHSVRAHVERVFRPDPRAMDHFMQGLKTELRGRMDG